MDAEEATRLALEYAEQKRAREFWKLQTPIGAHILVATHHPRYGHCLLDMPPHTNAAGWTALPMSCLAWIREQGGVVSEPRPGGPGWQTEHWFTLPNAATQGAFERYAEDKGIG